MQRNDILNGILILLIFMVFAVCMMAGIIESINESHPYMTGFIQFMIFASIGEMLSIRSIYKKWNYDIAFLCKAIAWGVAGVANTFAFKVIDIGIKEVVRIGFLPSFGYDVPGFWNDLLVAFYISATINLMFGPALNAYIRIAGVFTDIRVRGHRKVSLLECIDEINWREFISFAMFRCIPLFWIPTNTILFLMPEYCRISGAAILSIAFGIIMIVIRHREKYHSIFK